MNREGITWRIHLMIEVSKLASNKIQIFASWLRWITTTFAGVSEWVKVERVMWILSNHQTGVMMIRLMLLCGRLAAHGGHWSPNRAHLRESAWNWYINFLHFLETPRYYKKSLSPNSFPRNCEKVQEIVRGSLKLESCWWNQKSNFQQNPNFRFLQSVPAKLTVVVGHR
jgi:hypothetical protein